MSIGHFIAERLHVSATNREVIRTARNCLKPCSLQGPAYREERKKLYLEALVAHEENQRLYRSVMGGVR